MTAPRFQQLDILGGEAPSLAPSRHTPVRAHMRRVKGEAPPSGAERRDAAFEAMGHDAAVKRALAYVRTALIELYRTRVATWPATQPAFVNADDAARLLREWPACPPEIHSARRQNWRGLIFRAKSWRLTGESQPSLRPHMHGTTIPNWRYDAAVVPSPTPRTRRIP